MWKHFILATSISTLTAVSVSYGATGLNEVRVPALRTACRAFDRWFPPVGSEMLFVNCGGRDVLVQHPATLTGLVNIDTPTLAVDYVRFFTSMKRQSHFTLDGMVEIVASDAEAGGDEIHLDCKTFERLYKPLSVEQHDVSSGKIFTIRRTVLLGDGQVYRTTERVWDSGYYRLVELVPIVNGTGQEEPRSGTNPQ